MSTPTQKKKLRESMASYCRGAIANRQRIDYSQQRPFRLIDRLDVGWHTLDCSGFVVNVFWNAMHDENVYLRDPSGQKFSGYGNTWTMEDWLRENGSRITTQPYLVGDIAMYDGHTAVCYSRGTSGSASWASHGSEAGPLSVRLHYRPDVVGVWRHPVLT